MIDELVDLKLPYHPLMNSVYAGIAEVIREAITEAGEDPNDYRIVSCPSKPIGIERCDGKRIGRSVLLAIKKQLTAD